MGSFIVVMIAIAALVFFINAYQKDQRRKALAAWAESRNLTFSQDKWYEACDRFSEFDCLSKGSNRYGHNVIEGRWGERSILAFDYHYETYSHSSKGGRQTQHHYLSCVILRSRVLLKPLFIRPEGLFDKLGAMLGFDDIDFESAEFSRTFMVKSPDRKWAFDVLHQRTMEFLLAAPRFKIQFGLDCVIAYRDNTFSVEDFQNAADVIQGILDRLPQYLVTQQGELPPRACGIRS